MKSTYLKFIIFLLFFILIILVGVFSYNIIIQNSTQELIQSCSKNHDENSVIKCGTSTILNYQEKYDSLYYNHIHSHTIHLLFIGLFNECKTHATECTTHNESVFYNFMAECAKNGDIDCINASLDTKNPNGLNIFNDTMLKNIQSNIPKSCSDNFHDYFISLTSEQKQILSPEIIKACNY